MSNVANAPLAKPPRLSSAPTLTEVALACGVSPSTVSLAIRNSPRIKAATRQMVRAQAAKMGYRPNQLARQLKTQTSHTFGYVFPSTLELHHAMLVDQVYEHAFRVGYRLQLLLSQNDPIVEARAIDQCLESRVAGLILVGTAIDLEHLNEEHPLNQALAQRLPCLTIGRRCSHEIASAMFDVQQSTYSAAAHLLKRGYRQLRLLYIGRDQLRPGEPRVEGFFRALQEVGIEPQLGWLLSRQNEFQQLHGLTETGASMTQQYYNYRRNSEYGRELVRDALADCSHRIGLVCVNDVAAAAAVQYCQQRGLRCPQDVGIVGCDDTLGPDLNLTSFRWDYDAMARQCIAILLEELQGEQLQGEPIQGEQSPPHILVGGELVVRGTT